MEEDFGNGWVLHSYQGEFRPMLFGPHDTCCEMDDHGLVWIDYRDYEGRLPPAVPLAALEALDLANGLYIAEKNQ